MIEIYIVCWDIKFRTEKDSFVLKWFQRWQNFTPVIRTFHIQTEKTVQYWNDVNYDRTLYPLLEDQNYK